MDELDPIMKQVLQMVLPEIPSAPTSHTYSVEEFEALYAKVSQILQFVVYVKRDLAFLPGYREQASAIEVMALLVPQHIGWSFDVIDACLYILEDANLATAVKWLETLKETGRPLAERLPRAYPGRYLRGRAHVRELRRIMARRQEAVQLRRLHFIQGLL